MRWAMILLTCSVLCGCYEGQQDMATLETIWAGQIEWDQPNLKLLQKALVTCQADASGAEDDCDAREREAWSVVQAVTTCLGSDLPSCRTLTRRYSAEGYRFNDWAQVLLIVHPSGKLADITRCDLDTLLWPDNPLLRSVWGWQDRIAILHRHYQRYRGPILLAAGGIVGLLMLWGVARIRRNHQGRVAAARQYAEEQARVARMRAEYDRVSLLEKEVSLKRYREGEQVKSLLADLAEARRQIDQLMAEKELMLAPPPSAPPPPQPQENPVDEAIKQAFRHRSRNHKKKVFHSAQASNNTFV